MPDYSKGKIYKIVCNTTGLVYIGSTCEPTLARRLAGHRTSYNAFLKGTRSNITSFDILKNNNYEILLIETISCLTKDELHARERHFIESIECVNKYIPLQTKSEYYIVNKEKLTKCMKENYAENRDIRLANQKEYAQNNKDQIATYKKQYSEINKKKIKEYRLKNRKQSTEYQILYRLKKKELTIL